MITQASANPVFEGGGRADIVCTACEHLLARQVHPRSVIAIELRCFRCGEITQTVPWANDEPLPNRLVDEREILGRDLVVRGTVHIDARCTIASHAEVERIHALMSAQPPSGQFEVSEDGLRAAEAAFKRALPGFANAVGVVRRSAAKGNKDRHDCLLAWATVHLQQQVSKGVIDLSGPDSAALACVQIALHQISRWRHHPLFSDFAAGLVHQFPHAIAQLVAASWLSDTGTRVGFTKAPEAGRSPDLFMNEGPQERRGIEVKAPANLQWPRAMPSKAGVVNSIETQLRKARGQLSQEFGGLVFIGVTSYDALAEAVVNEALAELVARGRVSTRIAAIYVNLGGLIPTVQIDPLSGVRSFQIEVKHFSVANPRFNLGPFLWLPDGACD
jgi:hypothetical protein